MPTLFAQRQFYREEWPVFSSIVGDGSKRIQPSEIDVQSALDQPAEEFRTTSRARHLPARLVASIESARSGVLGWILAVDEVPLELLVRRGLEQRTGVAGLPADD